MYTVLIINEKFVAPIVAEFVHKEDAIEHYYKMVNEYGRNSVSMFVTDISTVKEVM